MDSDCDSSAEMIKFEAEKNIASKAETISFEEWKQQQQKPILNELKCQKRDIIFCFDKSEVEQIEFWGIQILQLKCPCYTSCKAQLSVDYLRQHLVDVHQCLPFQCFVSSDCGQQFETRYVWSLTIFVVHIFYHFNVDRMELEAHIESHGQLGSVVCAICQAAFSSTQLLLAHMHWYHLTGSFKCSNKTCNFKANNANAVYQHRHSEHRIQIKPVPKKPKSVMVQYECQIDDCNFVVTKNDQLTEHEALHFGKAQRSICINN